MVGKLHSARERPSKHNCHSHLHTHSQRIQSMQSVTFFVLLSIMNLFFTAWENGRVARKCLFTLYKLHYKLSNEIALL